MAAEWWTMAAKEGLVIYMRGAPVHYTLPEDLSERMLDYVDHVLPALSLLVTDAGTSSGSADVLFSAYSTLIVEAGACVLHTPTGPSKAI
jgi:hypothetical protein